MRKRIIYLDQSVFSHGLKGEARCVDLLSRLNNLASLQLVAVPYSDVHADETHQWRGKDDKTNNDLMQFVKSISRGAEFAPCDRIEFRQVLTSFRAFLAGQPTDFAIQESDAFKRDVHQWDDYYQINIGRYVGEIERIRELKTEYVKSLVDLFYKWQGTKSSFENDRRSEVAAIGFNYMKSYCDYLTRRIKDDELLPSGAASTVRKMLRLLPEGMDLGKQWATCATYFGSPHFESVPHVDISSRVFATLKKMVKGYPFLKKEAALEKHKGTYHDVKAISNYAPYCDAFFMDNAMARLVGQSSVALAPRYGTQVFSFSNLEQISIWLDVLEQGMSDEHRAALHMAYP